MFSMSRPAHVGHPPDVVQRRHHHRHAALRSERDANAGQLAGHRLPGHIQRQHEHGRHRGGGSRRTPHQVHEVLLDGHEGEAGCGVGAGLRGEGGGGDEGRVDADGGPLGQVGDGPGLVRAAAAAAGRPPPLLGVQLRRHLQLVAAVGVHAVQLPGQVDDERSARGAGKVGDELTALVAVRHVLAVVRVVGGDDVGGQRVGGQVQAQAAGGGERWVAVHMQRWLGFGVGGRGSLGVDAGDEEVDAQAGAEGDGEDDEGGGDHHAHVAGEVEEGLGGDGLVAG